MFVSCRNSALRLCVGETRRIIGEDEQEQSAFGIGTVSIATNNTLRNFKLNLYQDNLNANDSSQANDPSTLWPGESSYLLKYYFRLLPWSIISSRRSACNQMWPFKLYFSSYIVRNKFEQKILRCFYSTWSVWIVQGNHLTWKKSIFMLRLNLLSSIRIIAPAIESFRYMVSDIWVSHTKVTTSSSAQSLHLYWREQHCSMYICTTDLFSKLFLKNIVEGVE